MAKHLKFTDQFKAQVALEALRGDRTIQEIAAEHQAHLLPAGHNAAMPREANQVSTWKRQAGRGHGGCLRLGWQGGRPGRAGDEGAARLDRQAGGRERVGHKGSINEPGEQDVHDPPRPPDPRIRRQFKVVRPRRPAFKITPVGIDAATLALTKQIDRALTKYPFFGSRQIAAYLRRDGIVVLRHRVRRLMARIGLAAICKRPRTSEPHPQHAVRPYLLGGMVIDWPNQVLLSAMRAPPAGQRVCGHYLYPRSGRLPLSRGDPLPGRVMRSMIPRGTDWATRKVLSWRQSNIEPLERHWFE